MNDTCKAALRFMGYEERVIGCFKGLATGDAIGKQTEMLTRPEIHKWYPGGVTGFHGQPGDVIPRYRGKRYPWRIGETTDDTEQTIAVARAILREGDAGHEAIGKELLQCKKSVHPGVSMWSFLQLGDPSRIASEGDGCGAAMRAAPVGVIFPPARLDRLIRGAYECAIPTHGGQLAICAAVAVACAVSMAVEGAPAAEVMAAALIASQKAETLRPSGRASTISVSLERIYSDLRARKQLVADDIARQYYPDKTENIVPLAISLALITESAEETALLAANIGGDSDSVASIGGAIAGALCPESVNERWFEVVSSVNGDAILEIAASLSAMRTHW
jgi:ADP-ribosylglycohydrolase